MKILIVAGLPDFIPNESFDKYIGELAFDPSKHFRTGARIAVWQYLIADDYDAIVKFNH